MVRAFTDTLTHTHEHTRTHIDTQGSTHSHTLLKSDYNTFVDEGTRAKSEMSRE